MAISKLLRPASRLFAATSRPTVSASRAYFQSPTTLPAVARRCYATPSGVKEVAVRDALNEAMAEEMEKNDKVFILGEEVAQYNGAYVDPPLEDATGLLIPR